MGEAAQHRVGGYRIIRKLAVGGMAEIFLARLEGAHGFTKYVVLKRLLPHLCEDQTFVQMFLREARLSAKLTHPNIAQVFDIGEEGGRVHYAMEYVDGPELRHVAKRIHSRGDRPPLELAVGVGIGIAAGLHYAHSLRDPSGQLLHIVHRDVTPSNIMLTYDGMPKLLDFGVAKAQLDDDATTDVGVLKGKLPYMSPEQVDGATDLDGRSDVFSLGVVLWEMTTLRRLFRTDSRMETIRRIAKEDAPPPSSVCPGYPKRLEDILMCALARDRDERYPSALDLQRDLEELALAEQYVVSPTRAAETVGELFADELHEQRRWLEDAERERTDSQVFMAWTGRDASPGESAPSLPSATIVTPDDGTDDTAEPSALSFVDSVEFSEKPKRRTAVVIGAVGLAAVIGLTVWLARRGNSDETNPPSDAAVAAPEDPAGLEDPEPKSEAEPESEAKPNKPATEEPLEQEPEPAQTPQSKRRKRAKKTRAKKSGKTWNKNSLALPE
jgi:serine/threonine protein kinase